MCRLYFLLIFNDTKKYNGQIFNVGKENKKIKDIALIVKEEVENFLGKEIKLNFTKSDDIRSYRINSDKITNILNFEFKHTIRDAVLDLCKAFKMVKLKTALILNFKYKGSFGKKGK